MPQHIGFSTVDREALAHRMKRERPDNLDRRRGYALVNVLTPRDFKREHIPGSINIPQGDEELFERRFDREKEIVIYCASRDSDASLTVAQELARRGFTDVYDYEGGMRDWKEGPVES